MSARYDCRVFKSRSFTCAFSAYRQISGYEETCFKFVGGWVGYQMRKHGKVVCDWCEVVQNTLFRRRGGGDIGIGYSWLYERRVMRSLGEPRWSGGECEKTYRLRRAGSGRGLSRSCWRRWRDTHSSPMLKCCPKCCPNQPQPTPI